MEPFYKELDINQIFFILMFSGANFAIGCLTIAAGLLEKLLKLYQQEADKKLAIGLAYVANATGAAMFLTSFPDAVIIGYNLVVMTATGLHAWRPTREHICYKVVPEVLLRRLLTPAAPISIPLSLGIGYVVLVLNGFNT